MKTATAKKPVTRKLSSAAGLLLLMFAVTQLLVPAVSILALGASHAWLAGSALFFLAVVLTAYRAGLATRLALTMISAMSMVAALLLGASYYVQGQGFNSQFFYHLDPQTLAIASTAYAGLFYMALGLLALAIVLPLYLHRGEFFGGVALASSRRGAGALFLLWALVLATNYPLLSYLDYLGGDPGMSSGSYAVDARMDEDALEYLRDAGRLSGEAGKKNVILIYAESLEQLYFDKELFGVDLLPNLAELKGEAHNFTRIYQTQGSESTITGIIASQCGFPVSLSTHLATNTTLPTVDAPYERERCLGDVLRDGGYTTVFMGGAPLAFAGKGKFLSTHGYGEVLGLAALAPRLPDQKYRHKWGLYDDSLFELARDRLKKLESESEPYLLTLLTVDTHHPAGFIANSCERLENAGQMEAALHCGDQLISDFIRDAMTMTDSKETIIVLFSDHLSMRNRLWDTLQSRADDRLLTLMIFSDEAPRNFDVRGTHFDIAPTILDAAGLPRNLRMGWGYSLFYKDERDERLDIVTASSTARRPSLLNATDSATEFGVQISLDRLSLTVGDQEFKATADGRDFSRERGMFMIVFDDQGVPQDTIFSRNYARLARVLNGRFTVGLSISEESRDEVSYFYGPITADRDRLGERPLVRNTEITSAEIARAMRPQ